MSRWGWTPGSHRLRLAWVQGSHGCVPVVACADGIVHAAFDVEARSGDSYDGAMREALREVVGGVEIVLWIVPGASATEITGVHDGAVRIRIAQPAERGRANRAAIRLLADRLGAEVELVAGASARRKRVLVRGRSVAAVARALQG